MCKKSNGEQSGPKCSTMDVLGGIILFVCAFCLVVGVAFFFATQPPKPEVTKVEVQIHPDSLGRLAPYDRAAIDSLASVIRKQNEDVCNRYDYFIEQKENEIKLATYGGLLVSIIVAILGFFGYRSFKSIEEKAVQNAEDHVESRLTKMKNNLNKDLMAKIENRFDEEYQGKFTEEVKKQLNLQYDESINTRLNALDSKAEIITSLQSKQVLFDTVVSKLYEKGVLDEPVIADQGNDINEFSKERTAKREASENEVEKPSSNNGSANNKGKKGGKE